MSLTAAWPAGRLGRSMTAVLAAAIDRDVLATVGVRLLVVAGGFVSSIVTARWLTLAGRGEYFLVITFAQAFVQFGHFGVLSSNTYLVAQDRSRAAALLANSLWLAVLAGGGGAALTIAALTAHGTVPAHGLVWFAVLLAPASLFYMLGSNLLVGLRRIRAFNLFQVAANYGVLLCLLTAACLGAGPRGFLTASALGWTAVAVALALAIRRRAAGGFRFDRPTFRAGFRYALKAYVATLCGFIAIRSNVFILSAVGGAEQVGYYSVAMQMVDVIGILPQSMALLLFPALVTVGAGRLRATLRSMAAVGLLLAAGCSLAFVCAEPFIRIVFGSRFLPAVPLLRWMLPGAFCLGLTSVVSQYLAASGFPGSLVAVWVVGAAGSAALGWSLISVASGVGAAMALSLSHAAIFLAVLGLSVWHAHRRAGRPVVLPPVTEGLRL